MILNENIVSIIDLSGNNVIENNKTQMEVDDERPFSENVQKTSQISEKWQINSYYILDILINK